MGIEYEDKAFYPTKLEEDRKDDVFAVKLSKDGKERELLEQCKQVIEQEKDSTALKQLAWIGAKVILEEKMSYLLGTIFANKRKNKRLGIIQFEV